MLIPFEFALEQIPGLDVAQTLQTIRSWQRKLLDRALQEDDPIVFVSEQLTVDNSTLQHFSAGVQGDRVTSTGIALIKQYLSAGLLPTHFEAQFPESLQQYIEMNIEDRHALKNGLDAARNLTEDQFTYSTLFYLFDSVLGTRIGKDTLTIGHRAVTRTTQRIQTNAGWSFETTFMWENDACRTQYLHRDQ